MADKSVTVLPDNQETKVTLPMAGAKTFPYPDQLRRIQDYEYYEKLFLGDHFEAFSIRIDDDKYTKEYRRLRYIKANFAGLVSKIVADLLFSEPVTIKVDDGDQEWVDAFVYENRLNVLFYETALSNSYKGDAVFKLRVGKRNPYDKESAVIAEPASPNIYFPDLDQFNVTAQPVKQELAWMFTKDQKKYVRKEIHEAGRVTNEVWEMMEEKMVNKVGLDILGLPDLKEVEESKIDLPLLIHFANWKPAGRFFGLSDYYDLDSLFYAINNRFTKIDNILDKHSDPILAVPEGILDEKGQVRREKLAMIEIPDGVSGSKSVPQYIVWNASLENAFKEIEKLVEMMFMTSETSPDALGMGTGQSDSGRALKLKLLRTIAKAARKKLYFHYAIQDLIYRGQLLAKAWGLKVGGLKLSGEPVIPEIEWADGLPIDNAEQVEIESKRLADGNTTVADSIMRLDGVDEDIAKKKAKEIEEENKIDIPNMNRSLNPFDNNKTRPKEQKGK
jgi:hypothetical protein